MSLTEVAENNVAVNTKRASSAYVPTLQRTTGQPPPIAANGGLSYMSFDRDGDGGTRKALEDALALIAEGEGQRVADMVHNAPPGAPIETKWGVGFRKYDDCMAHIRGNNAVKAPEGGFALHDLSYTVPNCVDHKTDRLKKFWLQDRSAERYVFAYFRRWREVHGNERWPPTELAKKYAARFDEYEIGQLRKERPAIDPSREEVDKIWQLQLQDKPGKFFPLLGTRGIHADSAWKPPDANAYRRAAKGWEPLHIGGLVSPVLYGPRRTTAADTAAANADRLMVRSFLEEFRRHHRFDDDAAATPISKANNPNPTRAIQP